jgi:tRNA threonylcarbamoyl adenosine modification protein (Sua5/YciO/YrdC/YwlC family)
VAEHLYTYDDPPSEKDLRRTIAILENDGVIAYPTDVNWQFGCDAANTHALDKLRRLKPSHPKDRPFSLIVSSISMAAEYATVDHTAYRLLKKAWPGPYTILLTATRNLPRQLKDKRRIVGIRIPQSPLVLAVIEKLGRPLATTSVPEVMPAGGEFLQPPKFGYEVADVFGHALDLVLDLGREAAGTESTIVDMTQGVPEIVRRGAGDPALFEVAQ